MESESGMIASMAAEIAAGAEACETADAGTARIAALKAASEAGGPSDWAAALDQLRSAASLGSRLAMAELAALSGDWPTARLCPGYG